MKQECPDCGEEMVFVEVAVEDADSKVISYQCPSCGHFEFDQESSRKAVSELKDKHKKSRKEVEERIVKFTDNKLGIYLDAETVKSLNLMPGTKIWLSFPSKKRIVVRIDER